MSIFNVRVKIVEPDYAPTTDFTAKNSHRRDGLIPDLYAGYAAQLFGNLQNQTAPDIPKNPMSPQRFLPPRRTRAPNCVTRLGADSESSAQLRRTNSEDEYLKRMWETFAPQA